MTCVWCFFFRDSVPWALLNGGQPEYFPWGERLLGCIPLHRRDNRAALRCVGALKTEGRDEVL